MLGKRVPTNLLPSGGLKLNTKVIIFFDFLERIGTIVDMNFLETNQETWKIFRTWQQVGSPYFDLYFRGLVSLHLTLIAYSFLNVPVAPTKKTDQKNKVFVEGVCDGRGFLWTIFATWFSIVVGWTSRPKNWTLTSSMLKKAPSNQKPYYLDITTWDLVCIYTKIYVYNMLYVNTLCIHWPPYYMFIDFILSAIDLIAIQVLWPYQGSEIWL